MKRLFILLLLIPIVFGIEAVTGDMIAITSTAPSSDSIKDIVRGDLIREYGADYFVVNVNDLPKVGNPSKGIPLIPFLSFEISDKNINIQPNSLTVDDILIKPTGNVIYMPYTNYLLSENLKVINNEGIVVLKDHNFVIKTNELNVNDGVVYLHDTQLPVKIMPYMITYKLRQRTRNNIEKVEVSSKKDDLEYRYTTTRIGKLFYTWKKKVPVEITVNAVSGNIDIDKPWWALFTSGESRIFEEIDYTEFHGF